MLRCSISILLAGGMPPIAVMDDDSGEYSGMVFFTKPGLTCSNIIKIITAIRTINTIQVE